MSRKAARFPSSVSDIQLNLPSVLSLLPLIQVPQPHGVALAFTIFGCRPPPLTGKRAIFHSHATAKVKLNKCQAPRGSAFVERSYI